MIDSQTSKTSAVADWFGIAASSVCAVHCVVIPALLISGTVLPASFLADEGFHLLMLWAILPAAVIAFGIGCARHKDHWVISLGAIGISGMVLAAFVLHDLIGEVGERVVTVICAGILIAAHYRNFRLCRSADCAHDETAVADDLRT